MVHGGSESAGVWVSYQSVAGVLQPAVRLIDRSGPDDGYLDTASVADLNADGQPDIVVDSRLDGVDLAMQQADHSFSVTSLGGPSYSSANIALGDLDGDGRPDIVWASGAIAYVQLQLPNHTFKAPVANDLSVPNGPDVFWEMQIADANGDGRPDLGLEYGAVRIAYQGADGRFAPGDSSLPDIYSHTLVLADLNADGLADIIELNNKAVVHLQTSPGVFADTTIQCGTGHSSSSFGALDVGDVNGDGDPDRRDRHVHRNHRLLQRLARSRSGSEPPHRPVGHRHRRFGDLRGQRDPAPAPDGRCRR